ncbi:hypothetical protein GmHk_15G044125 [Glycine max]|nr:hypothetical protein GmHk_15G044125 [Glycine max]
MTLYAKSTTLARRSGPNFVKVVETLRGRMCERRHKPSRKKNSAPQVLSHGGYEFLENKLMEENKKKQLEEAAKSGSTDTVIDPPSPIRRHVKWKMARTKKIGQMTFEAAKEIADKIDSLEEQASQCSFVAHRRHDVLTAAIGRSEHSGRLCVSGASVMIKKYFAPTSRTSRTSSSMAPEDLEQLTQKIRDQLEESITKKVGVEEVRDADAPIPVPTEEVQLMGQALNTFVVWPTHLVKHLSKQVFHLGPAKLADRLDHDVDDPLYLMTLTIPKLFLKSLQNSNRDVYMGAYLNGAHWQMVLILPKENVVIWFCSLHKRPDNYLKGIINSALKGLDDTPQSKSKVAARWIVVKYFYDARPLEPERLKALRI